MNDTDNKWPLGTEKKISISVEPYEGMSMDDYDFKVEVFTKGRPLTIPKANAKRKDKDNYAICVDTTKIGKGKVTLKLYAYIPDADFEDLLRTEIVVIDTKFEVV